MSSLISVYRESLKNTCTFCEIISLKYINKPQHLCEKVHEQIQKTKPPNLRQNTSEEEKVEKDGSEPLLRTYLCSLQNAI